MKKSLSLEAPHLLHLPLLLRRHSGSPLRLLVLLNHLLLNHLLLNQKLLLNQLLLLLLLQALLFLQGHAWVHLQLLL